MKYSCFDPRFDYQSHAQECIPNMAVDVHSVAGRNIPYACNVFIDNDISKLNMTQFIGTLDGGEIATGFYGPDVSKIQLGELEPMATQQFALYAVKTVIENIYPTLDPLSCLDWAQRAQAINMEIKNVSTKQLTGQYFGNELMFLTEQLQGASAQERDELIHDIAAVASPVGDMEFYKDNPFSVQGDGTQIVFKDNKGEDAHTIASDDFYFLTTDVLRGGLMGWGSTGTYPEIKIAARALSECFED